MFVCVVCAHVCVCVVCIIFKHAAKRKRGAFRMLVEIGLSSGFRHANPVNTAVHGKHTHQRARPESWCKRGAAVHSSTQQLVIGGRCYGAHGVYSES